MNVAIKCNVTIKERIHYALENMLNTYSHNKINDTEELFDVCKILFDEILDKPSVNNILEYLSKFKLLEDHSLKTASLVSILCIKMGLNFNTTINTVTGALLHDIGLCSIYENYPNLENSYYKYTKKDFELIQLHPALGFNLIRSNTDISELSKKIILFHHIWDNQEKSYNNKLGIYMSYPILFEGAALKSNNKNISIRLVDACSRFINLTDTSKHYKQSISRIEALNIIKEESPYRFGNAGALLLNYISPYNIHEEVIVNNKNEGIVIKQSSNPVRPIIKITNGTMKNRTIDLSSNLLYVIKSLK